VVRSNLNIVSEQPASAQQMPLMQLHSAASAYSLESHYCFLCHSMSDNMLINNHITSITTKLAHSTE